MLMDEVDGVWEKEKENHEELHHLRDKQKRDLLRNEIDESEIMVDS